MADKEPRSKPTNFLEIHAGNHPDKTAFIGLDRSFTYGELRKRARVLAKNLFKLGIRPGDQLTKEGRKNEQNGINYRCIYRHRL